MRLGADPNSLEDLARAMARSAEMTASVRLQISRGIGATRWYGPAADALRSAWYRRAAIDLAAVVDDLFESSAELVRQAQQQRATSRSERGPGFVRRPGRPARRRPLRRPPPWWSRRVPATTSGFFLLMSRPALVASVRAPRTAHRRSRSDVASAAGAGTEEQLRQRAEVRGDGARDQQPQRAEVRGDRARDHDPGRSADHRQVPAAPAPRQQRQEQQERREGQRAVMPLTVVNHQERSPWVTAALFDGAGGRQRHEAEAALALGDHVIDDFDRWHSEILGPGSPLHPPRPDDGLAADPAGQSDPVGRSPSHLLPMGVAAIGVLAAGLYGRAGGAPGFAARQPRFSTLSAGLHVPGAARKHLADAAAPWLPSEVVADAGDLTDNRLVDVDDALRAVGGSVDDAAAAVAQALFGGS